MNTRGKWLLFAILDALFVACGEDDPDDGMGDAGAPTSASGSPTAGATSAASGAPDESESSGSSGDAPDDPPSGNCGTENCDFATQYCHESAYDGPSDYACRAIPPSCVDAPTCECVGSLVCDVEPFGCGGEQDGRLRVQCVEG